MAKIIAIEGVGGSGKTTLAAALTAHLTGLGHPTQTIKRPNHGAWASFCAHNPNPTPMQLDIFMRLDCSDALSTARLAPADFIILDRHYISSAIYQHPVDYLQRIDADVALHRRPHLWVWCDSPTSVIIDRLAAREDDRPHLDDPRRPDIIAGRRELYGRAAKHIGGPRALWWSDDGGTCSWAHSGGAVGVTGWDEGDEAEGVAWLAERIAAL